MGLFQKLKASLLDLDIYGHPIAVNFKGQTSYKTWIGVFCTLSVYVLVAWSMVVMTSAFFDGSRQDEKVDIVKYDRHTSGRQYLKDQGLKFYVFPYREF